MRKPPVKQSRDNDGNTTKFKALEFISMKYTSMNILNHDDKRFYFFSLQKECLMIQKQLFEQVDVFPNPEPFSKNCKCE